jgi:hypothetical protein
MLFRIVSLAEAFDGWPAGTTGTIVRAYEDGAVVEVSNDDGETEAFLSLPYSAIAIAEEQRTTRI